VLALQGDVREHLRALAHLGAEAVPVKSAEQLEHLDGLVIPGGESTTIGKLSERFGLLEPLRQRIDEGMAVFGTCAGLILPVRRRHRGLPAPGRASRRGRTPQRLRTPERLFRGRPRRRPGSTSLPRRVHPGPWVEKVGADVDVLARVDDHPVMVRQGRILGASFHPELTADDRIHRIFLDIVEADA
jgi:pyridoxal 5'-phosphate synthase pdxT subunit